MFKRDPKTAVIGKEILPFEMGYLPEFFQKKAEIELNYTPENRKNCLQGLRELMKDDKTFANVHYDDDFLTLFIMSRKHNLERAFKQMKSYTNFRRKHIAAFTDTNFDSIMNKIIRVIPWRCQDGCVVVTAKLDDWDPATFSLERLKKFYAVFFSQTLLDPMNQVNGFKGIIDMNANPLKHLRVLTPQAIHMMYHGLTESVPGRFKELHCVNTNVAGRAVWFIAKHFLSEQLKSRIFFHAAPEDLLNHFPPCVVPEEYGGEMKNCTATEEWLQRALKVENLERSPMVEIINTNLSTKKELKV